MFNRSKNQNDKRPQDTSVPKHASGSHFAHNMQQDITNTSAKDNSSIDSRFANAAGAHSASQSYLQDCSYTEFHIKQPISPRSSHLQPQGVPPAVKADNPYTQPSRKKLHKKDKVDRPRKKADVVSMLLVVVGVGLLLVSAGMFIKIYHGYHDARATYDELEQFVNLSDIDNDMPVVDFDELAKINPDIVAWIYVPSTNINYPVCSTTDNQKYLHTLFDGTPNDSGAIFMDMDDPPPGIQAPQTTLYGHHMLSGQMFNVVDAATASQEEFDKIEKAYYITPDVTYVFKPLLTARVSPDDEEVRDSYLEESTLQGYLERLLGVAHSTAPDTQRRLENAEQILTLVTCNYDLSTKQRSVLVFALDTKIDQKDIEQYSASE